MVANLLFRPAVLPTIYRHPADQSFTNAKAVSVESPSRLDKTAERSAACFRLSLSPGIPRVRSTASAKTVASPGATTIAAPHANSASSVPSSAVTTIGLPLASIPPSFDGSTRSAAPLSCGRAWRSAILRNAFSREYGWNGRNRRLGRAP